MVKFRLDPQNRPRLTEAELAHLDNLTDEEITAAAESDPDNLPLTEGELEHIDGAMFVRAVRQRTGLSQAKFAEAYRINPARLRDLEQGRTKPDSAMRAYLTVIARRPDVVAALDEGPLRPNDVAVEPAVMGALTALREKALWARRRYDRARRLREGQDLARDAWARAEQEHDEFLARHSGRHA
jgi:putative transcriptional regulator